MSLGVSRVISGLLMLATCVFGTTLVRDVQGAEVKSVPNVSPHVERTFESTPLVNTPAGVGNSVRREQTVIAPPTRRPRMKVTPEVATSQVVRTAETIAPTVIITPSPNPVVTVTPQLREVGYSIMGGGVNLEGKIETQEEPVGLLTKRIAANRGISFIYEVSDMGWFVTEIAGVKQNPRAGYYWLFYVNGALANRSADQVLVKAGDTLTWRYEKTN